MKLTIMLIFAVCSATAFAETATFTWNEGMDANGATTVYGNLYHKGYPISIKSDFNSVCKLMNFESYVPGTVKKLKDHGETYKYGYLGKLSKRWKLVKQLSPIINSEGLVSGEVYSSMIGSITCSKP